MFRPEELLSKEALKFVFSKLSMQDKLSCRSVCNCFKKEVDSILNKNQDRLWLRHRVDEYRHYFCYDKDHTILSRHRLYFGKTISIKNLKFVSSLMPSLKTLQLDPLDQVYRDDYNENDDYLYDVSLPDYRDKEDKAVPITKIFPQVACLILPGKTETDNFVGHLSQLKHLTIFDRVHEESPTFPNLDSLEVRKYTNYSGKHLPMPSKRFVVPHATIKWRNLTKTLEVIETGLKCDKYISVGIPHFSNLKILKGLYEETNVERLMNFLKDHKGSLTELSFCLEEEVANIKVLLPLLTEIQKLSVKIATDKQAIELKEIKALAHNLQYFELSFDLRSETEEHFGAILENLPLSLNNLSIEDVTSYEDIDMFIEKILEKVVNGDTATVTIVGVDHDDEDEANYIIDEIVKIKPSPVTVEKRDIRVLEDARGGCGSRSWVHYNRTICDIVIYL